MEEILRKHQDLLERWKKEELHSNCVFIEDGIIDIERWGRSKKKILILLKEAYGEEKSWSLVKTIRDVWKGPKYKIWWTISYWLYAIQKSHSNEVPLFPQSEAEYHECVEFLLSSAVVNIKKSSGKSHSNYDDLRKYAEKDRVYLREQIKLINPDIIICGYTKELLEIFWDEKIHKINNTDLIYDSSGIKIIDYWHPANQYPDKLNYYTLGSLYSRTL